MSAICNIIEMQGPKNPQQGSIIRLTFTLRNTGDEAGNIKVEPIGLVYPDDYDIDPWLYLEIGASGAYTVTLKSWSGKAVSIGAYHWDTYTNTWVLDKTVSWPASALDAKLLLAVAAVLAVGAVVLLRKR